MTSRTLIVASAAALAIAGVAGCASSDDASTSATPSGAASASASLIGGMAVCDQETFTTAVEDLLVAEGSGDQLYSLDGFECADGWAVTFPTIGQSEDTSYTYTQVFQADGQFWNPVDRDGVCGTTNPDDPSAFPADSLIPEAIWQPACNTN